jgi:hypothetical protein
MVFITPQNIAPSPFSLVEDFADAVCKILPRTNLTLIAARFTLHGLHSLLRDERNPVD